MTTLNTCKKCGCQDAFLTTPPPCPTPVACPDPEPCSEVFDAQCVIYTGDVLTSGITVEEAIDELAAGGGGGGLTIPNLKVGALNGDVHVSLDFYDNPSWLDYHPKIFLFRTKKKKRPNEDKNFTGRPSQFVHTTHMAGGAGSKWFEGSLAYEGGGPILRHTEFTVAETIPYKRFNLADQGMSPFEWITYIYTAACNQITISYDTNFGNVSQSLTTLGTLNGHNYYQFNIDGKIFQIYYNSGADEWVVQWTGDAPGVFSCVGGSGECPGGGKKWGITDSSASGVIFTAFSVMNDPTNIKRQALQSDFTRYQGTTSIGVTSLQDNGYAFYINTIKGELGNINFSKQKIHFKLAIVIDNPNATPDKPFLIGPMSDAFVVRFVNTDDPGNVENYAKFTNDYISSIAT